MVARVVTAHWINNTYLGPRVMAAAWVRALLDGWSWAVVPDC